MVKNALLNGFLLLSMLTVGITLGWLFLFLLDIPGFPSTANSAAWDSGLSTLGRVIINVCLMLLFGLQHSVMARGAFKRWLQRWVDYRLERMVYMASSAWVLWLMLQFWQPINHPLWIVDQFSWLVYTGFALGAGIAAWAGLSIDGAELAGLRQWRAFQQQTEWAGLPFQQPLIYRFVRHPMQLGVLMMVWFIPAMTVGQALFAVGMTLYVLVGLYFEERQLYRTYGEVYAAYRQQVPMLIPRVIPRHLRT